MKPKLGKYKFILPYTFTYCIKHGGIGITGCLEYANIKFKTNDIVNITYLNYNKGTNKWFGRINFEGKDITTIPLDKLEKVPDSTPVTQIKKEDSELKRTTREGNKDLFTKKNIILYGGSGVGIIGLAILGYFLFIKK